MQFDLGPDAVAFLQPGARIGVHLIHDEYGGQSRLLDFYVNNGTATFKRAAVEADQMANGAGWLIVDGLTLADCGEDAVILRLNGYGIGGEFRKNYVDVRAVVSASNYRAALEVIGKGWHGRFNGAQLDRGNGIGDGAAKITVTPPAEIP